MTTPLFDCPTARYRFYDSTGRPIYFGVAVDPEKRWDFHRLLSRWWHLVDHDRTKVEWYVDRRCALAAEAEAIKAEDPRYNKAHAVRGIGATEFKMQLRDLLHRTHLRGEAFAVTWHGEQMGVLVPPDWFAEAQALMAAAEGGDIAA